MKKWGFLNYVRNDGLRIGNDSVEKIEKRIEKGDVVEEESILKIEKDKEGEINIKIERERNMKGIG